MAEESLRESLDAAFDKVESSAPSPAPSAPSPALSQDSTPVSTKPEGLGGAPAPSATPTPTPAPETDPYPVPRAWKPDVRDKWSAVPSEVKAEIARREGEIIHGLQRAAEARKFHEEFARTIQPYQMYFDMDKMTPIEGFREYLTTAALLRNGSPQQKASALANVITQFGIDVSTLDHTLAEALRGRAVAAPQQQQYGDPRVDHILQRLEQQDRMARQRVETSLTSEVKSFESDPQNEFFNDVRNDVADLLELYANRNEKLTLKQAYERACEFNPTVRKAIEQRKLASARQSASSLRPGGAPQAPASSTGKPLSIRESIEASIAQHS